MEERVAIGGVRTAVDVQDQRIPVCLPGTPPASGSRRGSSARRSWCTRISSGGVISSSAKSLAFSEVSRSGGPGAGLNQEEIARLGGGGGEHGQA